MHSGCRTRVRCFATVPPTVVRLSASAPQNMGSTEPGNEFAACSDPLRRPAGAGTGGPPTHPMRLSQGVSRRLRACIWSRLLKLVLRSPVRTIL